MVRKFLSTRSLLQAPLQIMASSVVASTVRHNIEGNGEWQPMYCNAQRINCDDGIVIYVWLDATYREQDKHSYLSGLVLVTSHPIRCFIRHHWALGSAFA